MRPINHYYRNCFALAFIVILLTCSCIAAHRYMRFYCAHNAVVVRYYRTTNSSGGSVRSDTALQFIGYWVCSDEYLYNEYNTTRDINTAGLIVCKKKHFISDEELSLFARDFKAWKNNNK